MWSVKLTNDADLAVTNPRFPSSPLPLFSLLPLTSSSCPLLSLFFSLSFTLYTYINSSNVYLLCHFTFPFINPFSLLFSFFLVNYFPFNAREINIILGIVINIVSLPLAWKIIMSSYSLLFLILLLSSSLLSSPLFSSPLLSSSSASSSSSSSHQEICDQVQYWPLDAC